MRTCLSLVVADAADAELAADALWALGAVAVEERADELVAGFADDDAVRRAHDALEGRWSARVVDLGVRWHDVLRSPPTRVDVGDITVDVDPGTVFGNGEHPTTRMALDALATHLRPGDRVLDVGSGTGVLAVAAARMGAALVVAVDVDPEAVDVTRANAVRNGVTVDASTTPVREVAGAFDVVVANLGGRLVIEELAGALRARTDRALIVGGLLDDGRPPPVIGDLHVDAVVRRDGWATIVYVCR